MPQFDPSCILKFTIPGDAVNIYAMIDANIVASAKQGLTAAQQLVVDSYVWVPTTLQLQGIPNTAPMGQASNGTAPVCPTWAGADPAPVYFRATAVQVQVALAKWYK